MKLIYIFSLHFLLLSFIQANDLANKPNVIFIMADDLGWQDVGFMGSQWFETPALDQLAKESVVFNRAYMYPTCSPSRAALLTGKQSFRTGVYTVPVLEKGKAQDNIFSRWTVGLEHTVYAKPLSEAGYKTIHLGKWHIVGPDPIKELAQTYPLKSRINQPGNGKFDWLDEHMSQEVQQYYPQGRGFDENVGGTWWGDPARGHKQGYNTKGGGYIAPYKNPFIKEGTDGEWLTDRLTKDAIDFMDRSYKKKEPFFVNLHYYAPHRPTVARDENWLESFMQKSGDKNTRQGTNPKSKKTIAAYATMVKSIDENVQHIIDYLDANNLRENTVIIFTSDNGGNGLQTTTANLRGSKGNIYEGGIRVPALINWSGKIQPQVSDTPITGIDYFPTFLDIAGISDYEGLLDGDSLLPLLQHEESSLLTSRPLYWHIASTYKDKPASIIMKDEWKMIQFLLDGSIELYNLEIDLKESNNLALEYTQVVDELTSELQEWRKANSVSLPPNSQLKF